MRGKVLARSLVRHEGDGVTAEEVQRQYIAAPKKMHALHFTFTNRCNLRCVYCPQGTHAEGFHADVTDEYIEALTRFVKEKQVDEVGVGYYGELLLIDGWENYANRLLDMGVAMTAVSNFSRVLRLAEVATFARFKEIQFSIDTHHVETLRSVRKAVDPRTIVHNFHLIRSYCMQKGIASPAMIWTGVLTDHVVSQLPDFVAFAASNGVTLMNFNDVGYFTACERPYRNISDLEGPELVAAFGHIVRALEIARFSRIQLRIQGTDRIERKIRAMAEGRSESIPERHEMALIQGTCLTANDQLVSPGTTRLCTSPWSEAYLDPKGEVYPCCAKGTVMGRFTSQSDLESIWDGDVYRNLRRSLISGENLDIECHRCPVRPVVPLSTLRAKLQKLGIVESEEA